MNQTRLQDTTLWKMIVDVSNTSFEQVRDYLTDSRCDPDLEIIKNRVAQWGFDSVHEINEKWVVQMILIAFRPGDLLIDTKPSATCDLYQRATEWVRMLSEDTMEQTQMATFVKKTMTLKLVYMNWRKRDIREQLYVLVEMYVYYQEILGEFDCFLKMQDRAPTDTTVHNPEDEAIIGQIEVWRGFYTDFSATLLELIKLFAPTNYMSWIEGVAKKKEEQLLNNPGLMERLAETTRRRLRWSFWKEREYKYVQFMAENQVEEQIKWRRELFNEWNAIGEGKDGTPQASPEQSPIHPSIEDDSKSTSVVSVYKTEEGLLRYCVDSCIAIDKPTMRELYNYIISQYESGQYTFIQAISVIFQRWWLLRCDK